MLFRRVCQLILIALLIAPLPVSAANINPEGAKKLKAIFENYIAQQKDLQLQQSAHTEYDGEVMVETAGNYYAVTLPQAAVVYPDGSRINIGMVSINAAPADVPGQWKMALAVPTPIIMTDSQKNPAFKINIGGQKAAGIWDEKLENFAKLDAQYKDITVENPSIGFTAKIGETNIRYDFKSGADGLWSGPAHIIAKNIMMAGKQAGGVSVASVGGDFSVDGYNPSILKDYRDYLKDFLKNQVSGTTPDPQKSQELASKIGNVLLTAAQNFQGTYGFTDLQIDQVDPERKVPEKLKIATGSLGVNFSNMRTDKVGLGFQAGFDGFSITPPPPGYDGIIPAALNLNIALHDIPALQISTVVQNTLSGANVQPNMAPMIGLALMGKIPALLSQAGTYLEIKNTFIGNDAYRFETSGTAKADVSAATNVVANINSSFTGLDELIRNVQAIAADPKQPAAPKAQGLLQSLESMKASGKAEQPVNGKSKYTYEFKITPQGQMLLNGLPFNPTGVMRAQPPASPLPGAAAPATP